jgi:hypothetical protein
MYQSLFWTALRSIAIPYVAFLLLQDTPLGEKGAILAIAIALAFVTVVTFGMTLLKILGNTLMLRGNAIIGLILSVVIQLIALGYIWFYYADNFTNVL